MSKAKMEAAKELIQEKKYAEARAILKTVDHPTAAEWVAKIDERVKAEHPKSGKKRTLIAVGATIALLLIAAILYLKLQVEPGVVAITDKMYVSLACSSSHGYDKAASDTCNAWAERTYPKIQQTIRSCPEGHDYDTRIALLHECLTKSGIVFP